MTTKELSRYLQNEEVAEEWLREKNILKTFEACPLCGSGHLGRIRRERYKCYACKREWNTRKGSYLESKHLALSKFIGIMKMFCDEVSASKCSYELEVYRNTVNELYHEFRNTLIGPISDYPDVNLANIVIVLEGNKVVVSISNKGLVIPQVSNIRLKRQKQPDGKYFYNIEYKSISSKKILKAIDKIDGIDVFYRYCQERVLKFRGRDISGLYFTLKELAFRYNHRSESIFDLLINGLVVAKKTIGTGGALFNNAQV